MVGWINSDKTKDNINKDNTNKRQLQGSREEREIKRW